MIYKQGARSGRLRRALGLGVTVGAAALAMSLLVAQPAQADRYYGGHRHGHHGHHGSSFGLFFSIPLGPIFGGHTYYRDPYYPPAYHYPPPYYPHGRVYYDYGYRKHHGHHHRHHPGCRH